MRLTNPMNVGVVASPSKPEKASGEACTSDDDFGQTPLWNGNVVVGGELLLVARLTRENEGSGKELTSNHAKERKASNTEVHAMNALEDQRIGREEEVK